jgi:RNA polymerase sigma factor (sigma-70 family)
MPENIDKIDTVSVTGLENICEVREYFIDQYGRIIYTAVRDFLRSRGDSRDHSDFEDACQDILLGLFRNEDRVMKLVLKADSPSGYLYKLSFQAAGRFFSRLWKKRKHLPEDNMGEMHIDADVIELIDAFVVSLSVREQQLFSMRFGESLSFSEIAQRMNVPVNTVGTWLARLKTKLKKELVAKGVTL